MDEQKLKDDIARSKAHRKKIISELIDMCRLAQAHGVELGPKLHYDETEGDPNSHVLAYAGDPEDRLHELELLTDPATGLTLKELLTQLRSESRPVPDLLPWPVDKINNTVWTDLPKRKDGSATPIKTGKAADGAVFVQWSIEETIRSCGVDVPVVLDAFDMRLNFAAASLSRISPCVTFEQLHRTMTGKNSSPSSKQIDRIKASLEKQRVVVELDNSREVEAGFRYPAHHYKGPLLQWSYDTITWRGKQFSGVVISRIPLYEFALGRKQITEVRRCLLDIPLDNRNSTLAIENYLLFRIKENRGGNRRTILYSTIFKNCDIERPEEKSRSKQKVRIIIDSFKAKNEIFDWFETKNSIVVVLKAEK